MELDISVLEEIGMTNAQIKVYLALLELGQSKTGEIIKKSGVHSSVVYNALMQLTKNGLATFIIKGKTKHFSATAPENLVKYIDDKKSRIQKMLPLLKRKLLTEKQEAQVYTGWKGIYNAFNKVLEILPKKGEYIAFGMGFEEQFTEETRKFFREYQKKRDTMKYDMKIILNESAREQANNYEFYPKFGKPKYRFVPGFCPHGPLIFEDNLLIAEFGKNPIAVIITSKPIANSFRKAFYQMWKIAKA